MSQIRSSARFPKLDSPDSVADAIYSSEELRWLLRQGFNWELVGVRAQQWKDHDDCFYVIDVIGNGATASVLKNCAAKERNEKINVLWIHSLQKHINKILTETAESLVLPVALRSPATTNGFRSPRIFAFLTIESSRDLDSLREICRELMSDPDMGMVELFFCPFREILTGGRVFLEIAHDHCEIFDPTPLLSSERAHSISKKRPASVTAKKALSDKSLLRDVAMAAIVGGLAGMFFTPLPETVIIGAFGGAFALVGSNLYAERRAEKD